MNPKPASDYSTAAQPDGIASALTWARDVLDAEAEAILSLKNRLGPEFEQAVGLLLGVQGQVLTSGVGKSGLVAKKIAATLTSTGTPANFVHPVDAVHGDLGIVSPRDAAILLSKSGETPELLGILPAFRRRGVPILTMTCQPGSTLARGSDCVLDLGRLREACPEDLVPTTSTTAFLALGDALAVVVLRMKGFSREDFVFLHPGGILGQTAMLRVADLMHRGDALPRVEVEATLREALLEILNKRLGMTTIVDGQGILRGVLTDGDLKRILLKGAASLDQPVGHVMTMTPRTIDGEALIAQAVRRMEEDPRGAITSLVIVDGCGEPQGVIHLHDCLGAGTRVP